MRVEDLRRSRNGEADGAAMYRLIRDLYPICRSITGDGVRETLRVLGRAIPLDVREVPTGRPVFDWTIPREWNIRDAYILAPDGRKIADFSRSNLHVVGYSPPVRARMTLAELRPRLHVHPERDDLVPYRTSPYEERWGFCLSRREMDSLPEGEYEVVIDSTLEDGALTYGEYAIAGREENEVLLSTHVCHPSLCNDNLSGIALVARLAEALTGLDLRYTYRFLFIPAMIGAIAWLQENEARAGLIRHGLVIACVGDRGGITYKRSRKRNALVDRAAAHVLATRGGAHEVLDFSPDGYDERQFASPGFDLPVGWLTRTPGGRYPEYHSSADDLSLVDPASLADSLDACLAVIDVLESDARYRSTNMKCEPQLGRRGLYGPSAEAGKAAPSRSALLWVLNFSDGAHSLLEVAERSGLPFDEVREAARALLRAGLLEPEAGR